MNILDKINRNKQVEVDQRLGRITALVKGPKDQRRPKDFRGALTGEEIRVIAEVKKASPSKGVIRSDFDPVAIALAYQKAGATCLSVLTEEAYFQGSNQYLLDIRAAVELPILRKDFIVDPRQIRETYELGADALLLILASLLDEQLDEFYALAKGYGLSVLAEVHDRNQLDRAKEPGFDLIWVNNRNLKTFETSLATSLELVDAMPQGVVKISESGIGDWADLQRLQKAGYNGVLVGERLMRAVDPGHALLELRGKL